MGGGFTLGLGQPSRPAGREGLVGAELVPRRRGRCGEVCGRRARWPGHRGQQGEQGRAGSRGPEAAARALPPAKTPPQVRWKRFPERSDSVPGGSCGGQAGGERSGRGRGQAGRGQGGAGRAGSGVRREDAGCGGLGRGQHTLERPGALGGA